MVESARYDEIFSKMEALLIASDAYFHTIAVENLLNIINETCKNSEEDIKQAEELKDKGMVLGADFYAAKVILGSLKNMKNELMGQREALHALLNILMGESPLKPLYLADTIKEVRQDSKVLKDWLSDAYEYRADLRSIEQVIEAQKTEVSREKARILPNISAFGDLRENTQDFNTGGGSFAVGIKGTIDVFDPEYFVRIRLARASLNRLESQKDAVKDSISKDVIDGYMHLRSIYENIPLLHQMTGDAGQAVDLTLPLYREGRKSIADLLEMRQAYVGTYQSYYFTMTDSKVSWARLLFLSGQLDESKVEQALHIGE
jgi:outer membrane protein TolC